MDSEYHRYRHIIDRVNNTLMFITVYILDNVPTLFTVDIGYTIGKQTVVK